MSTTGLGGSVALRIECEGCRIGFEFRSDPSKELKHQVVASFIAAGIEHSKYHQFGTNLGNDMSVMT